ncbi:MAG: hypothetical protein ACK5LR_01835 [Mangrovibacterium sp.]
MIKDILQVNALQSEVSDFDWEAFKEQQYDRLAAHVRAHVNMEHIYESLTR